MKVKLLFTALILTAGLAQAQYGHRTYYKDTLSSEWFNDGMITDQLLVSGQPVYIGVGRIQSPGTGTAGIERSRFVRTKFDGTVQYNRRLNIFRNGVELSSRLNGVAEANSAFVMAGTVSGAHLNPNPITGGSDVLLMKTTAVGVPSNTWRVDLGGADEAKVTLRSTRTSSNYFTAGSSTVPGAAGNAFIMRHTATGTIAWLKKFTIPCNGGLANTEITGIAQDSASGNVVVVGNYTSIGGNCGGAFIARFTNGGALSWLYTYNPVSYSGLSFQSIRPTATPKVYVIAAYAISAGAGGYRPILIKVTTSGTAPVINFAMMYITPNPTPNFPISYQKPWDVVSRINTAGAEEFFLGGETGYTTGLTDGNIIKTNAGGASISCRFYFGGGNQAIYALDKVSNLGTPGDGIAAFGRWDQYNNTGLAIGTRSWLIRSYFNLVSGCYDIASTPTGTSVTLQGTAVSVALSSTYNADSLQTQNSGLLNATLCWNTSLSSGSNVRLTEEGEDEAALTNEVMDVLVYPNPVSGETPATMQVSVSRACASELTIVDITGRVIERRQQDLLEGMNEIKIPADTWQTGMYLIQLKTEDGQSSVTRLMVR
ncbi:MAG: T9SS type A sorting domain-containing protein [Bacteroidia bacterium]